MPDHVLGDCMEMSSQGEGTGPNQNIQIQSEAKGL